MQSPAEHLASRLDPLIAELPENLRSAVSLMPPKDRRFGDLALGCFPLAKARAMPPQRVATEIADGFAADDVIESATATGPFVNFKFRRAAMARYAVTGVLQRVAPFGPATTPTGRSIVIDFSSPNIAKPFHMGHLRSTVIGAALRRIYRHLGDEVHGINHLGDWGSQFGKIMVAWRSWGDEDKLEADPMRHLHSIYVRINNELKAEKAAGGSALADASAEAFRKLEAGEPAERELWQKLRDVSLAAFEKPYARLGIEFDHVAGESFYEDKMEATVAALEAAGITTMSDGALVVEFEGKKIPPCILRKSDGTTIYATRDLAALFYRRENYRFDKALYVVGGEQKLHFTQLKLVLEKLGWPEAAGVEHINFGLLLSFDEADGKWKKMSSRKGSDQAAAGDAGESGTIFLEELLDEAVANVRATIQEKNPDLANPDEVAEQVGVSAVVFNDLKNSRIKDVKFDWDQLLNFDGETGPYVQYAVARLAGILRKAEFDGDLDPGTVDFDLLADADQVLLTMLDFGPTVRRAADQNEPSLITNLMIRLAGDIHSYLSDHHVLRATGDLRTARIALVVAARDLLRIGLGLLGVAAPDRM